MSRHRGLHAETPGGECVAKDTLLPGGPGDDHQGGQARDAEGGRPDHQEGPLASVYRVSLFLFQQPDSSDFISSYLLWVYYQMSQEPSNK